MGVTARYPHRISGRSAAEATTMTTTHVPLRTKRGDGLDAAAVLDRLGIEATNAGAWTLAPIATSGPTLPSINPATGEPIADGALRRPRPVRAGRARRAAGVSRVARMAGAAARRGGAPARRPPSRSSGGARPPGDARGRQDRERRPRRGAGDDRHGRPRGRHVAPALRQDHALGAPGAPDVRAVASARSGRRHHRLQLSGRGVGVERDGGGGLRRLVDLEALAPGAAHGDRGDADRRRGAARERRARDLQPGDRRRRRGGPRAGRRPPRAPDLGDRLGAHGPSGRRRGGASAWVARCSSSAATTASSCSTTPISVSRCARWCSRPPAPPASAAPPAGGSSSSAGSRPTFRDRLLDAYASIRVGDPADEDTLMGPLISEAAVATAERAVAEAQRRRAKVLTGGKRLDRARLLLRAHAGVGAARSTAAAGGDLRADPLSGRSRRPRSRHPAAQRRAAGAVVGDLHVERAARPSASSRSPAATAASPT